jgi:hypothetical protein
VAAGVKASRGLKRKDGHTVKKLMALLLVVAFVCAGTVGCGGSSSPAKAPPTGGAGGAGGAGGGGAPK